MVGFVWGVCVSVCVCVCVCVSVCVCVCELVTQLCSTLCDPMDCRLPGSSVPGISQARLLSGLPFPSPGDLPNPGLNPSPALQANSLPPELSGKPELSGLLLIFPDMCLCVWEGEEWQGQWEAGIKKKKERLSYLNFWSSELRWVSKLLFPPSALASLDSASENDWQF